VKRTPPWVWLAAVAVQIAALCVCTWAMEQWLSEESDRDDERIWPRPGRRARRGPAGNPSPRPPQEPAQPAAAPAPQQAAPPPYTAPVPPPAPSPYANGAYPAAPEPAAPQPPPSPPDRELRPAYEAWREEAEVIRPPQPPPAAPPPAVPMFGPPPAREEDPDAVPAFIAEAADGTTQLMRASVAGRPVTFGFYPDGNIRFVDVDGGRYAGKAESARARMREVDGTRAFTVQIAVDGQQQLQAIFTGGVHDSETLALEPLVGWSVA